MDVVAVESKVDLAKAHLIKQTVSIGLDLGVWATKRFRDKKDYSACDFWSGMRGEVK